MRLTITIIFLVQAVLTAGFCVAQENRQETSADKYRVVHWSTNDGVIRDNFNFPMLKDEDGFLWIGSENGLSRFDGNKFKHYLPDKNRSGSIIGKHIWSLIEDSLNHIWIGSEKGLSHYDAETETFRNFLVDTSLVVTNVSIIPIWADRNEVYCVESGSLVTKYDIHSLTKKELGRISLEDISYNTFHISNSVFDPKSNSIWMLEGYLDQPDVGLLH